MNDGREVQQKDQARLREGERNGATGVS